jgi:hypothetical protein
MYDYLIITEQSITEQSITITSQSALQRNERLKIAETDGRQTDRQTDRQIDRQTDR